MAATREEVEGWISRAKELGARPVVGYPPNGGKSIRYASIKEFATLNRIAYDRAKRAVDNAAEVDGWVLKPVCEHKRDRPDLSSAKVVGRGTNPQPLTPPATAKEYGSPYPECELPARWEWEKADKASMEAMTEEVRAQASRDAFLAKLHLIQQDSKSKSKE